MTRLEEVCVECVNACIASRMPMDEAAGYRMCGVLSDAALAYLTQEMSRRQLFDDAPHQPYTGELVPDRPLLSDVDSGAVEYCVPRRKYLNQP